jgi:carotenoid 1,2-hydratase
MRRADIFAAGTSRSANRSAQRSDHQNHPAGFQSAVSGNGGRAIRPGIARMDGLVPPAGLTNTDSGTLYGGRQRSSGTGHTDGGDVGSVGRGGTAGGFDFDLAVPAGGYKWWYVDALSADGAFGVAIIAFIGSVFSPYYALARRIGCGDPLNFCAFNVALYGPRRKIWTMTERGRDFVSRDSLSLAIGPSNVSWDGDCLTFQLAETAVPIPSRLRGVVRVFPKALANGTHRLDASGRHRWRPIAPRSHVEVAMTDPTVRWRGEGYVDTNAGDEPLEEAFHSWTWSRANLRRGTAILYDVAGRHGTSLPLALIYDPKGDVESLRLPPKVTLPPTRWGIARETYADDAGSVRVERALESAPFYARTLISTRLFGEHALAVHESLSLNRFRTPWVQAMLPFRMPRALGLLA